MIPFNHFWSVFSERDKIEPRFTSAIEKSRQMFDNYDIYAKERITNYSDALQTIIENLLQNGSIDQGLTRSRNI